MPSIDNARQPFKEQIAFHRNKLKNLIPTERWDDIRHSAHDHGVMVAGAQKADLLADLANSITGFIEDGKSIDQFRKEFDATVDKHGWNYRGERNWRTRVIYQTNMATSYSAGRLAQLRDPELQKAAPYWMYIHSDLVDSPRLQHKAWDKTTLPADDAWFKTHYAPNGWGCQCRITAVSRSMAERDGGIFKRPTKPGDTQGIDDGWDYMPGDSVSSIQQQIEEKAAKLPPEIAQSLVTDIAVQSVIRRGKILGDDAIEFAVLVDTRGRKWLDKQGGKSSVNFSTLQRSEMDSSVLIHNHPSSSSLSGGDLRFASAMGLKEIVAAGHDGVVYWATNFNDQKIKLSYNIFNGVVRAAVIKRVQQKEITVKMAERWHHHILNSALSHSGAFNYSTNMETPTWADKIIQEVINAILD